MAITAKEAFSQINNYRTLYGGKIELSAKCYCCPDNVVLKLEADGVVVFSSLDSNTIIDLLVEVTSAHGDSLLSSDSSSQSWSLGFEVEDKGWQEVLSSKDLLPIK